jgi:hypothetical protein
MGGAFSSDDKDENGVLYKEYVRDETFDIKKLERYAQTGDILLFSGSSMFSKTIKFATETPWTHVAVIIRFGKDVFVLQAIYETSKMYFDYLTRDYRDSGVMMNSLEDVISEDKGKVYYRKLKLLGKRILNPLTVENFLNMVKGKKYEKNPVTLLSSATRSNLEEDPTSYFCSELVIDFWRFNRLLDTRKLQTNPQNVIPSDFVYEKEQDQFLLMPWAKLIRMYKVF